MYIKQIWQGPLGYRYSYDDALNDCNSSSDHEWSKGPVECFALVGDYTAYGVVETDLFILNRINVK